MVHIVKVELESQELAKVWFSGPVEIDIEAIPDDAFKIGGNAATGASDDAGANYTTHLGNGTFAWTVGDTWTLTSQPNWLLTPCQTGSGTTV